MYRVDCKCGSAAYVGETKKKIMTRIGEHERDVLHGRLEKTGLAEHSRICPQSFDFDNAQTLAVESRYRYRKMIREAPNLKLATN